MDVAIPSSVLPALPAPAPRDAVAWQTAQEFESVLLGQLTGLMMQTSKSSETFGGGGAAEDNWRGVMAEQMGRTMARSGGIGLASHVYDQIIRMQGGAK
jgi:peptidoglycan hydrolase FlgJ